MIVFLVFSGGLSLAIEGPSKTEIKCRDNEDGTCTVTYVPTAPGEYNITVKFADKNISGSPFTAKITGTSLRVMSYIILYIAVDQIFCGFSYKILIKRSANL